MSTMVFATITFGSKYIVGTWFALLLTGFLLAIPVPIVAFITLKSTTTVIQPEEIEEQGARVNPDFAGGFPHHEIHYGSPVFVRRITWRLEPKHEEFDLKQMISDRYQNNHT